MAADSAPAPPTCVSLAEELAATQDELRRVREEVDSLRRTVEPLTGMQMKVDQLMYALTLAQKLYKSPDNQRPDRAKRMAKKATSAASKAATCASPDCCSGEAAESGTSVEAGASKPAVPVASAKPPKGEERAAETRNPTSPQATAKGDAPLAPAPVCNTPSAPASACPTARSSPRPAGVTPVGVTPVGVSPAGGSPRVSPRATLKSKRRDDDTPPPTVECRVVVHGPDVGDPPVAAFAPTEEPIFHAGTATPPKDCTKPLPLDATATPSTSASRGKKNKGRKKKGAATAATEAKASGDTADKTTTTPAKPDVEGSPARGIFLFGSPLTPSTPKDATPTGGVTGAGAFVFSSSPAGSPFTGLGSSPSTFPFAAKPGSLGVPVTNTWYLPKTATSPAMTATAVLFGHSSPPVIPPSPFAQAWEAGVKDAEGKKDNAPPLVK